MIRELIRASRSYGKRLQSAVMKSFVSTLRIATAFSYVRASPITPTLCTGSNTAKEKCRPAPARSLGRTCCGGGSGESKGSYPCSAWRPLISSSHPRLAPSSRTRLATGTTTSSTTTTAESTSAASSSSGLFEAVQTHLSATDQEDSDVDVSSQASEQSEEMAPAGPPTPAAGRSAASPPPPRARRGCVPRCPHCAIRRC